MSQCSLCSMGVGLEPGVPHVDVAHTYGVSEASVRRHRKHPWFSGQDGATSSSQIEDETLEEFAATHGVDPASLEPYGVSYNHPNGWVKYRVREDAANALTYDDIDFSGPAWGTAPVEPDRDKGSGAPILNASDWQIGKAGERGGGTPETVACIRRGFFEFQHRLQRTHFEEAALIDGGDIIENLWNTPSQPYTNDLDLTSQIRTARRLMAEGIRMLAPYVDRLVVGAVPSNHGEVRVGKQARAGSIEADFGLDIHESLREIFEDRPEYSHVEFVRPEPLELTLVVNLAGTEVAFNHGHTAGNGKNDKRWWADQAHGRRPGWDADILVLNHLHNLGLQQSGNERWIIRTSSPDCGSGWYSDKTGETAKRGQTTFTVLDGEWFDLSIL